MMLIIISMVLLCIGWILLMTCLDTDTSFRIVFGVIILGMIMLVIGGYLQKIPESTTHTADIGVIQIYDTQGSLIEEYEVRH